MILLNFMSLLDLIYIYLISTMFMSSFIIIYLSLNLMKHLYLEDLIFIELAQIFDFIISTSMLYFVQNFVLMIIAF
jgi:hypothetical protein